MERKVWGTRLLDYLAQKPAAIGLRSQYAIRLYAWAKDHLSAGTKRITLEQLRTVLGLDWVKDTDGNVIREAPLAAWANFRQRALNIAIAEINAKTDLNVALKCAGESRAFAGDGVDFRHQSSNGIESKNHRLEPIMPPDLANLFNPLTCKADLHLLDDPCDR